MLILIFILSLLPSILIYLWLRKRNAAGSKYRSLCSHAFLRGAFLCVVLVLVLSSIFYLIERIILLLGVGSVVAAIYHNFIVLALSEELVKYFALKGLIKKNPYSYSWLDITSLMMIIGIGFGLSESVVYAFGANAGIMLTRGFTAMHCGYGFIMGFFVGKGMKAGNNRYTAIGILLPFLLHGTYDCCLSDTIGQVNENLIYISLILAVAAIVTLVIAIIHVRRAKRKVKYTTSLFSDPSNLQSTAMQ